MSQVEKVLDFFRDEGKWGRQVAHWERIAPRPAEFGDWPETNPDIMKRFARVDRPALFPPVRSGRKQPGRKPHHVVTPTAAGKPIANPPVLQRICDNPEARALLPFRPRLFPRTRCSNHGLSENWTARSRFCIDGDTSPRRKAIRNSGHIVVTNPDMLHTGICPPHQLIKLLKPGNHCHRRPPVPGYLWQPHGECPVAAQTHLCVLRRLAAVHLLPATIANPKGSLKN
jgi:DEAD/DEAH box helicase domain-containing protein